MKRRTFFKAITAALTAAIAPALAPDWRGLTYSTYRFHPAQEWMMDALFENMKNQPPYDGTFSLSLHTGKAIFYGAHGESAKPSQRETKSLPDRQ